MPRTFTPEELDEFTPAEIEALRGEPAAQVEDPPTTEDPPPAQEPDDTAAASTQATARTEVVDPPQTASPPATPEPDAQTQGAGKDDTDPAALADVLAEAQPAEPARYELPDTARIAEQRKTLREQRAALDAKWLTGNLSDAERAEKVGAIDDQLDDLLKQATRAETLAEVNRQNALNDQQRVIEAIRREGARAGIDYQPDGEAAGQFDTALQMLTARKDQAGKSFEELARQAHRVVLALNGKLEPPAAPAPSAAPPASAPAAAPAPRPPLNIPPTLGQMPAAARPPIADDFMTEFAGIDDPDRAEAMLENMPARQREALLRSTVKAQ